MGLPIVTSVLDIGRSIARQFRGEEFYSPKELELKLAEIAKQDTAPAAATRGDTLDIVKRLEGEIGAKISGGAQAPIQPQIQPSQPIQEGGGMVDVAGALGEARPREQFVQPQVPDLVSRVLAGKQIAETPETVQTLNGVQEGGIAPQVQPQPVDVPSRFAGFRGTQEIPDAVAAEAPGMLERFGEGVKAIAGELGTNPVLRDLLSQVAQALSAREPQSFPYQLATGIREAAQTQQMGLVRQSVLDKLAGREPDDRFDLNMSVLPPDMQMQAILSGYGELGAAVDISEKLAGIPTEQERAAEFELTQSQIDATDALVQQRYADIISTLSTAGAIDQFDSNALGLLRFINQRATQTASLLFEHTGMGVGPSGEKTFLFKDPQKANEMIDNLFNSQVQLLVDAGKLPESSILLTRGPSETDANVSIPNTRSLDRTAQPPNSVAKDTRLPRGSKFIGSQREEKGTTLWWFDTTGDGRADTPVRK